MFSATTVAWRCDCVAAAVTRFVRLEMIECLRTMSGQRASVSMMRIEAVINVAVEAGCAVEPWAGSDEDTAVEPLGAVVPVWSAVVRGVIEVAIRANRRCSDIDGDLGGCRTRDAQQVGNQDGKGKEFLMAHNFS